MINIAPNQTKYIDMLLKPLLKFQEECIPRLILKLILFIHKKDKAGVEKAKRESLQHHHENAEFFYALGEKF